MLGTVHFTIFFSVLPYNAQWLLYVPLALTY
jgi:hypothetical protein